MSWCSPGRIVALLGAGLAAASPCRAQLREVQVWSLAVASQPALYAAGLGLAWRDNQRSRVAPALALGALGNGRFGARADLAVHFLLDPYKREGMALYGGGGITAALAGGRVTPYALLVLGAERAPGGKGGAFIEIGVGGGVRLAVGYRWRKSNAPGR
jgi:hypothetical protein